MSHGACVTPWCWLQVAKQSNAARSMCLWVRALDVYGRMVRVVEPKRQALHQAEAALAEVEAKLAAKRSQLRLEGIGQPACLPRRTQNHYVMHEVDEELYKLRPANKTDHF